MKSNVGIKFKAAVAAAVIGLTIISTAVAYEVTTHRTMTRLAALRSNMGIDANLLWRLGIGVDPDSPFLEQRLRYTDDEGRYHDVSPAYMMDEGAELEDDGFRALNHFFDPISGDGVIGSPSPEWSLEPEENWSQGWSYRDMTDELGAAMLSAGEEEVSRRFARVFRALGHVIHHVQDMAQPQHTRLDPHCNTAGCENTYFFYEPSFYEWLSAGMSNGGFHNANGDVVIGPSDPGDYPNVHLYRVRDYWHQDAGFGMADYSNRNFVTADTNFVRDENGNIVTTDFASPGLADWVEIDVDGATFQDAAGIPLQGDLKLVRVPVTDSYLGTAPAWTHDTSSQSLFATDVRQAIDEGVPPELFDEHEAVFYLNRINLESANRHLYQRAIGYSAGFIDHVFRGRLEIAPPEGNIYALIDHAVTNEASEGFTSIELKLRNATPAQTSPDSSVAIDGHVIKTGTLVAVALFRPNPCYTQDLHGELDEDGAIANGCSVGEWRQTEQHRVVSAEIDVNGLGSSEFTDFEFDFSANPIPVNARDLSIQVIFRGEIGGDEDAFAVVRKKISEPTWFSGVNSTDYLGVNGVYEEALPFINSAAAEEWDISGSTQDELEWGPQAIDFVAYFNHMTDEQLTEWVPLDLLKYHRLAMLAEPDEILSIRSTVFFQLHYSGSIYSFTPVVTKLEETPEVVSIPGVGSMTRIVRRWRYTPILKTRAIPARVTAIHALSLGEDIQDIETQLALPEIPAVGMPEPVALLEEE